LFSARQKLAMRLFLNLSLLTLGFYSVTQAVVHIISTQKQMVHPNSPEYPHFVERQRLQQRQRIGQHALNSRSHGAIKTDSSYYRNLGNISVGTPAQLFTIDIDLFDDGSLTLVASNASVNAPYSLANQTFNSSLSSTYTDLNLNLTSAMGNGHIGNDILAIGNTLKTKIDFGIVDYPVFTDYFKAGVLGLSPLFYIQKNNSTRVLDQIVDSLDQPVISIYSNGTCLERANIVTIGALDTENCQSNWIYVPRVSNRHFSYAFHLSSVELTVNGEKKTVGLNATMTLDPFSTFIYLPKALEPYLVNATNAVYNSTIGYKVVDCDTSKAAKLVFNVGGQGNLTTSANKQLVISAADYISYSEYYQSCYLSAYFYYNMDFVFMGMQFHDNHCIAYNIKDNTVGFADSKTPISIFH